MKKLRIVFTVFAFTARGEIKGRVKAVICCFYVNRFP